MPQNNVAKLGMLRKNTRSLKRAVKPNRAGSLKARTAEVCVISCRKNCSGVQRILDKSPPSVMTASKAMGTITHLAKTIQSHEAT